MHKSRGRLTVRRSYSPSPTPERGSYRSGTTLKTISPEVVFFVGLGANLQSRTRKEYGVRSTEFGTEKRSGPLVPNSAPRILQLTPCTRHSVLSTRYSALGTQHSELGTPYSVLCTLNSALPALPALTSPPRASAGWLRRRPHPSGRTSWRTPGSGSRRSRHHASAGRPPQA